MKELQRQGNPNIVIALAGNKSDLSSKRKVEPEDAETYSNDNGIFFMETSAKTATNVNELFVAIGALPRPACPARHPLHPRHATTHRHVAHRPFAEACVADACYLRAQPASCRRTRRSNGQASRAASCLRRTTRRLPKRGAAAESVTEWALHAACSRCDCKAVGVIERALT